MEESNDKTVADKFYELLKSEISFQSNRKISESSNKLFIMNIKDKNYIQPTSSTGCW